MKNAKNKAIENISHREEKKHEMAKRMFGMNKHRTYPLKEEVSELRKHRGEKEAEEGLKSYREHKQHYKSSGVWGKANAKGY